MLASSIGWILVVSGIPTAAAGLAALLSPKTVLGLVFGSTDTSPITIFFARHWGALLFVVCSLTVYAAFSRHPRANPDSGSYREAGHIHTDFLR